MKTLSAVLTFVAVSTIAATGLAFALGGITTAAASIALIVGLALAVVGWIQTNPGPTPTLKFWDYALLGVFAFASYRAFCWLIYTRGDEVLVLSPNNLGDLSLHINFIRYLASGVPFWPESPILSGVPLTYPIGADLFNALGERLGLDTFRTLVGTGLVGAMLTGFALWRWGGAFGVAALLLNGGLAGFAIFSSWELVDFQQKLIWKNLFLSMLVTQRGLLFALPAGLLLLTHWRNVYFRHEPRILPYWLEFILYAGMPLFNLHAFLFLSLILAAIFLVNPAARRSTGALVAASFVPATVLVALVTGFFAVKGEARWEPGWLWEENGPLGLIRDFGFTLPLLAVLGIVLIFQKDREARCFVWSSLLVLAVCCVVVFAPWPWDNMKLMIWSWLVIAPYLWSQLLARFELIPRIVVLVGLFFSGAVSLIGGLDARHGYSIAHRSELDAWKTALVDIPISTRFACGPDFNHPLLLLGRKVACGYDGHLWSHGLPYQEKYTLLLNALAGRAEWKDAAPALQSDLLVMRVDDLKKIGVPTAPTQMGVIYDLRPFLRPNQGTPELQPLPPRSVDLLW